MFVRAIFEELMLYISGKTDNKILQDKNFVLKPIKSHIDGLGVKRVSRQIKNLQKDNL